MFDAETQSDLFNEFISPGVIAEIRAGSKLFDQIRKDWKQINVYGEYATQRLMMAASQSTGARSNSAYPEAKESTPGKTSVFVKRAQMFSLHFDGMTLEAAERGGMPINPIEFEKKGIFISISDDMSRQLMGDGSGRIAQCNGAGVATATLLVDSPLFANASRALKAGRLIDIYTDAVPGVHQVDSIEILTRDTNGQITLVSPASWDNNSWVFGEDTHTETEGLGLGEMMGLMGIIDDGDPPKPNAGGLQGLPVGTYPQWVAYVDDNGGVPRPLVEDLWIQALDESEDFAVCNVILVSRGVRRSWFSILSSYKTLPNQKVMWGGWAGLPFIYDGREIAIVPDKFVPDGTALGISQENLVIHVLNPNIVTWEKGDSDKILQKVAGKNEFVAEGHIFGNMGTGLRPAFFRVDDIQEP